MIQNVHTDQKTKQKYKPKIQARPAQVCPKQNIWTETSHAGQRVVGVWVVGQERDSFHLVQWSWSALRRLCLHEWRQLWSCCPISDETNNEASLVYVKNRSVGGGGYLCLKMSWEFSFFTMERENKQHIKSMWHECVNCKGDEYRWKT